MPNYNISVVVDPSGTVSGVSVVENNLDKVSTKARKVKADVQGAFDFSTTTATANVGAVDKALDNMGSSASASGRQIETAMNKAEASAARANGRLVNSQAQVRQSTLSLGQQFNDFSTQVQSGGSAVTAFAQQSGQAAFALQGMNGILGTVGRFLAGPFGTVAIIATTVVAGFVTKLLSQNDALDEAVKKLKDDAKETETAAKAKDLYARTAQGLMQALREQNAELEKGTKSIREQEQADLAGAQAKLAQTLATREQLKAQIELRRDLAEAQLSRANMPNQQGEMAALGLPAAQQALADANKRLTENQTAIDLAQRGVRLASIPIAVRTSEELSTATGRINREYDALKGTAIAAARGNDQLNRSLATTLTQIEQRRQAALEAQRVEARSETRGDGVSRFTSRAQAVGVAGRELQGAGLRVSENAQFGGITQGAHQSAHTNAIDVNQGTGVVEANIPDLKAKFDALALAYQARGYRVIWNGQVYAPGGSGPGGSASGHRDHLHVEAPGSIVGKETQASTAQQQLRELQQYATAVEQQKDFIDSVVDRAASRGTKSTVAGAATAEVERVGSDFERRFNRTMTDIEKTLVETSINEAVARETADHFAEAYTEPLERLQALQGTVGMARKVLNATLAETARLGRELTPVEAGLIENGLRQSDQLDRQASLLAELQAPLQAYQDRLTDLNALLAAGTINQTTYNGQVAALGGAAVAALGEMPGTDPLSGQSYVDLAATAEEDSRYARELELYQNNRAQLLELGLSYDGLEQAAHRRHVDNLNAIDQSRRQVALGAAQSTFDSLSQIAAAGFGEQSAAYKAMFAVSKAFAIAQSIISIQQGIAETMKLPFPANLVAAAGVAAQAASIISNIQAVSLAFADGGYVAGPGTGRSDSVNAKLSNGEYVVNASATKANRPLLDAINSGTRGPALAGSGQGGGITVNVGDVIVQGGGSDGQQVGREVKQALVSIVREELGVQSRSGGALTRTRTSVMAGG